MASGKVIFTGPYGPGLSATTQNFNNLAKMEIDFVKGIITMTPLDGSVNLVQDQLVYSGITSFTATISGGLTTVTFS